MKKVFITLHEGAYKYRKKRFIGMRGSNNFRAQFICNECEKLGKFTGAIARIECNSENEADDEYLLLQYPHPDAHVCAPCGMEGHIDRFRKEVEQRVRENPTKAMPATYDEVRSVQLMRLSYQSLIGGISISTFLYNCYESACIYRQKKTI